MLASHKIAWQPATSLYLLQQRAALLARIRQFFLERHVLEVETPLLSQATVTDKHLHSFKTHYFSDSFDQKQALYLQTSPEFGMKRLLAAGSGPIYQITKAFRNRGESGRYHNPEFTLLEWYRPDFNHHQLMDEVETLLKKILDCPPAQRLSYAEIFQQYLAIDPHQISLTQLKQVACYYNIATQHLSLTSPDDWLNLFMTHLIEPQLSKQPVVFIYDFPLSQAALSKIRPGNPAVAERFEVYIQGLELANGFHELNSSQEQCQRFMHELEQRKQAGYSLIPIDQRLLAALDHLPDCSGVALGIDRLLMLVTKQASIQDVMAFPLEHA